jgi:hypothetical protein
VSGNDFLGARDRKPAIEEVGGGAGRRQT